MPYSLRRRRKIVAALKLPRPESVQTEIEERGVSIQKARRKRTHDIDNLAIIHVSSCNDVLALQEMSLATFRIELGLHSMCMSRLHALYFMLRTPMTLARELHGGVPARLVEDVPTITCLLLRTCLYVAIYISCPLRSWIAPARQQCHAFS